MQCCTFHGYVRTFRKLAFVTAKAWSKYIAILVTVYCTSSSRTFVQCNYENMRTSGARVYLIVKKDAMGFLVLYTLVLS